MSRGRTPTKRRTTADRLTYRERERIREGVIRHLVHALAGMFDIHGDLAMSLLETGRALHGIAELDVDQGGSAYKDVMAALDLHRGKEE
jgi:hypothetical protein